LDKIIVEDRIEILFLFMVDNCLSFAPLGSFPTPIRLLRVLSFPLHDFCLALYPLVFPQKKTVVLQKVKVNRRSKVLRTFYTLLLLKRHRGITILSIVILISIHGQKEVHSLLARGKGYVIVLVLLTLF
jgi:hypothetical protein